jgi:hypothetical protein
MARGPKSMVMQLKVRNMKGLANRDFPVLSKKRR